MGCFGEGRPSKVICLSRPPPLDQRLVHGQRDLFVPPCSVEERGRIRIDGSGRTEEKSLVADKELRRERYEFKVGLHCQQCLI